MAATIPVSQCAPLGSVQHRLAVGTPLPFNIRSANGTLLLARGYVLPNAQQLEALLERGALVDLQELGDPDHEEIRTAPRERLPIIWSLCFHRVRSALESAGMPHFSPALDTASDTVRALIHRDPELAIFQILRHDTVSRQQGVTRSTHAATAAQLAAHTLGWSDDESLRAFKAALTMNVSMLDLQGQLASQVTPPSTLQRRTIDDHPVRSREMLEQSGVRDDDWLQAVELHHEDEHGRGYPRRRHDITTLSRLLSSADVYTSMLSTRATRGALMADSAARKLYAANPSNPMAAALIKAFGLYPPGCHVRLVGGVLAVVMARGAAANTPVVAALTFRDGLPRPEPVLLDTASKAHAVVQVVDDRQVKVRIPAERLLRLT